MSNGELLKLVQFGKKYTKSKNIKILNHSDLWESGDYTPSLDNYEYQNDDLFIEYDVPSVTIDNVPYGTDKCNFFITKYGDEWFYLHVEKVGGSDDDVKVFKCDQLEGVMSQMTDLAGQPKYSDNNLEKTKEIKSILDNLSSGLSKYTSDELDVIYNSLDDLRISLKSI